MPVIHGHFISAMFFKSINGSSGQPRAQLVSMIEVRTIVDITLATDSYRYRAILWCCAIHFSFVFFDRFYHTNFQIISFGYDKWSSNSKLSFDYIDSHNDWVFPVENGFLHNFYHTWENGVFITFAHSIFSAGFNVQSELIKQMINNFSCENLDTFVVSEFLSFFRYSYIECKNRGVLFLHDLLFLGQNFHCFKNIFFMNWSNGNVTN